MSVTIRGKEYVEVKERIRELYVKHPDAVILTEIIWHPQDNMNQVLFVARIFKNKEILAVGHAYEERSGDSAEVNETAWVENCETSAIGRALANLDIGVNIAGGIQRPSAEEMDKVARMSKPATAPERKPLPLKVVPRQVGLPQNKEAVYAESLATLLREHKERFGHDQYYLQLASAISKDLSNPSEIKTTIGREEYLTESKKFFDFMDDGVKGLNDKATSFRDLTEEQRKAMEERAKKWLLLAGLPF